MGLGAFLASCSKDDDKDDGLVGTKWTTTNFADGYTNILFFTSNTEFRGEELENGQLQIYNGSYIYSQPHIKLWFGKDGGYVGEGTVSGKKMNIIYEEDGYEEVFTKQ